MKSAPKLDPKFTEPIAAMIEESPSFGYRTVAHLLSFNKSIVQRIFLLKGWPVKKHPASGVVLGCDGAQRGWSTDLCRRWATLALVIDCHTRELLGWHLSRSGKAV